MGWYDPKSGWGYGLQPDLDDTDSWNVFRRELPGSAGGLEGDWSIYITAGCYPGGTGDALYVDGVVVY